MTKEHSAAELTGLQTFVADPLPLRLILRICRLGQIDQNIKSPPFTTGQQTAYHLLGHAGHIAGAIGCTPLANHIQDTEPLYLRFNGFGY